MIREQKGTVIPPHRPYGLVDAYSDWRADPIESHGVKAAFIAGWRAAMRVHEQTDFVNLAPGTQVVTLEQIRKIISMGLLPGLDEGLADAAIVALNKAAEVQQANRESQRSTVANSNCNERTK